MATSWTGGSTSASSGASKRNRARPSGNNLALSPSKKSKRPKIYDENVTRRLPEKIVGYVPEAEAYDRLVEFERRLDATLLRKQLDIQESKQGKTSRTTKILRMFIYNTYDNQQGYYHVDEAGVHEPPSWTLRIEGYLFDQEVDLQRRTTSRPTKTKFSRFFRKVLVQLDKDVYTPNDTIEWDKAQSHGDTDGFEIKRAGDAETTAKIILHLDYAPNRFKLSPALGGALGMHTDTRPKIVLGVWQYVRANRLHDPEDRRYVVCDEVLQEAFGCTRFAASDLTRLVSEHLSPADPIEIEYTIKREGDWQDYRECYDIEVEVDETLPQKHPILNNPASSREMLQLDDQIGKLIDQIKDHARKRDFLADFYKEPITAMNKLVQDQVLDYKLMTGATDTEASLPEDERHADYYYQPFTLKAVEKYLQRP
ncbi:SWIB/MDM2 domain containing protein [Acanthamoeba castellanii str. Neff]|uniref:SWIB/MDM2 domain containing protein n=1 Tax=Acanthamoeba castellanii (strain ATCC 30010 / Neff) TaxID=1257118 RepID=L8GE42_ACACF|nr:SWIB/MDM2 domain containing protein [Acanthamoeba castellanii str. Neff]ELR11094.1 SWIB/MDM2 domain containing protein [Acanthamoeba castellanii str. Neff]